MCIRTLNKILKKEKSLNLSGILISIAIVIIYFFFVFHFAYNIPFWDEYDSLLDFINYFNNKSFSESLHYLFKNSNEHRIFTHRLVFIIQYLIEGEINFKHIIIIGNLGLIWIFLILINIFSDFKENRVIYIPIALLLFIPQNQFSDWGMVTFNSIIEYALVLTSLSFLNKKGKFDFTMAILFALIATFSFGNGMLVFIVGYIILFFKNQKSLIKFSLWSLFMIIAILTYFYNYNIPNGLGSKFDAIYQPVKAFRFFFTIWGGIFSPVFNENLFLCTILGLMSFLFFSFLIIKKWSFIKKNPLLLSYFSFLFLSSIMITISRLGFGISESIASRYILLPTLFIVLIFILTIKSDGLLNNRLIFPFLFVFLTIYSIRIYKQYDSLSWHKTKLTEGLASYYFDKENTSLGYPKQKRANMILSTSIDDEFYNPPYLDELTCSPRWDGIENEIEYKDGIKYYIDTIGISSQKLNITGWAFIDGENFRNQRIGIFLLSNSDSLILKPTIITRLDVVDYFKSKYPDIIDNCGFQLSINWKLNNISPDNYSISIGIIKDEKLIRYIRTDKNIIWNNY